MNEFIDHLKDVFRLFGPFAAKRMFSGCGLFRDGLMFGLVVRDTLYLKADAVSVPQFTGLGMAPSSTSARERSRGCPTTRPPKP